MNLLESYFLKSMVCISRCAEYTGIFYILRKIRKRKTIILMYHGITPKNDPIKNFDGKYVTSDIFEKHIQYLQKKYTILSLEDYCNKSPQRIPENGIILTFDDGYLNNYKTLFPIIKKYKIPITIFPVVNYIDSNEIAWFDIVRYCITETKRESITIEKKYELKTDKQKIAALIELKEKVKQSHQKKFILQKIIKETAVNPHMCTDEDFQFMTWAQCQEMSNAGISFGSHTLNHSILTGVSQDMLQKELHMSKIILERKLKTSCTAFTYPFGDYNSSVVIAVAKEGYKCACTTKYGKNSSNTSFMELVRIPVSGNMSLPIFILNLHWNYAKLHMQLKKIYFSLKFFLNNLV